MLYLDDLGEAANCKMKHETRSSMMKKLNRTGHCSGLGETFQRLSYNRISGIMTWRSKSYQRLSCMIDSSAAFSDKFRSYP